MHKKSNQLLDTTNESDKSKWIFVMSTSKKLYAGKKTKGAFHHSSFLAGGAALSAGSFTVVDGILKSISAYSGHYRPTDENLGSFLEFLKEHDVSLHEVGVQSTDNYYDNNYENKQERAGLKGINKAEPASFRLQVLGTPEEQNKSEAVASETFLKVSLITQEKRCLERPIS